METFIRHALDRQLVAVEKRYLDDTGRRFVLDFYDTALLPNGQIKMRWGKAIHIAYSDLTEITLERVEDSDDEWYAKKFENFNKHIEKQLGRLEKLSDDILARFSQSARIDARVADMSLAGLVGNSNAQQVDSSLTFFVRKVEVLADISETQQISAAKPEKLIERNSLQAKWNAMGDETKSNFRKAWKIWKRMRSEYRREFADGQTIDAQPKIKDWQTKVMEDLHWDVSDSRLRDVKEMGEAGVIR